jgi:hypothetical protein
MNRGSGRAGWKRAAAVAGIVAVVAVGAVVSAACGPALCGGVRCTANAECAAEPAGEVCRCRAGFQDREGLCRPAGPCAEWAARLCESVGSNATACAALQAGVATADGPACASQLEGDPAESVAWLGEVEGMLERPIPAAYRTILTRSLLDPCGAAAALLCTVSRPGTPGCGQNAAVTSDNHPACRSLVRQYDATVRVEGTGAEEGAEEPLVVTGVRVFLVPDPANAGTIAGGRFRAAMVTLREEIETCYAGAARSFPGLAGRAVFRVRIAPDGVVSIELGRADGPISGSGVATCVADALRGLTFRNAPPEGGECVIHASFDFGVQ